LSDFQPSIPKSKKLALKHTPYKTKIPFFQSPPHSVRDLEELTAHMREFTVVNRFHFVYDYDGKINPSKYGSIGTLDLGLCYETHHTHQRCRLGKTCVWRHAELTLAEKSWMISIGANRVAFFEECRTWPEEPEETVWDKAIVRCFSLVILVTTHSNMNSSST
jgi:hypothetical protein